MENTKRHYYDVSCGGDRHGGSAFRRVYGRRGCVDSFASVVTAIGADVRDDSQFDYYGKSINLPFFDY